MTRRKRAIDEHYICKAADETVNNSDTLQDDDDLLFPVGASQTWAFTLWLYVTSGTTPDLKVAIIVPASTTGGAIVVDEIQTLWIGLGGSGGAVAGQGGARAIVIQGMAKITTAGNVKLQWAQNTADASDTKILAGSSLIAWRIA